MGNRTFREELGRALRKQNGRNCHQEHEIYRVHREAVRDAAHAFSRVEMPGSRKRTGLTI